MSEMPTITALAPWFGSKRNLAPAIVEELGPHRTYWEICCGSMAVLLAKDPCRAETVADLHGGLICLARVLADELAAPRFYERLQRTLFCESLHNDADAFFAAAGREPAWWLCDAKHGEKPRVRRSDANMAEYAYWYFVHSWMGRNGMAGTRRSTSNFCVRYDTTGGDPATRFRGAVESIPAWHERLRRVTILRRDIFEVLPRIEDREAVSIYCDPPYLEKETEYQHDFASEDHERLSVALRRFGKARVVLSYYDHPELTNLYPGWCQRKIEVPKSLAHNSRRGPNSARAVEVLLMNGPSAREARQLF